MSERILHVFLNDRRAGELTQQVNGALTYTYDTDYAEQTGMAISLSLPVQREPHSGVNANAFFSGLLPEGIVLDGLAHYLSVSEQNSFALLAAVGGDCAGALALYPEGMGPAMQETDAEVLDEVTLKETLMLIKRRPMLAGDDNIRLSLAGAQDKLPVGFDNGRVMLMKGGTPTTHIIKPMIEWVEDSNHNELFCMRLAKRVGLSVPQAGLHWAGGIPYYLVERYDRQRTMDGCIQRIHQEDICQATGNPPGIKYEQAGGPDIAACRQLITSHSDKPALNQLRLLEMIIFNYLIGNHNAHGKNFSLLYKNRKPELAPAYDLISTAVYPGLSKKMAMNIGGEHDPEAVRLHHWLQLVADTKAAGTALTRQLSILATRTSDMTTLVKEELAAEGAASAVIKNICRLIEQRASRILAETG